MPLSVPPTPPTTSDTAGFAAAADAWVAWEHDDLYPYLAALGTPSGLEGGTMLGALNWAAAVTVASATTNTTDIGAAASNLVDLSGTVTMTGFASAPAGVWRHVRHTGVHTLTYNATSFILIGGTNITTTNGDISTFVSLGSGNWAQYAFHRAGSGTPNHYYRSLGTIADDAVVDLPWFSSGGLLIFLIPSASAAQGGMFWARTASSGAIASDMGATGGGTFGYYNTTLSGTTGADAQFNVSATTEHIYFENRTGTARSWSIHVLAF